MPLGGAEGDHLAVDEEVLRVVAADEDGHHLRVVLDEVSLEDRGPVVVVGAGEAAVAVRRLHDTHERVRAHRVPEAEAEVLAERVADVEDRHGLGVRRLAEGHRGR